MRLGIWAFLLSGLAWGWVLEKVLNGYWQLVISLVAGLMVAGIGITILSGFVGIISLGHAGFMAVGAYVYALLAQKWLEWAGSIPIWGFGIISFSAGLAALMSSVFWLLPISHLRGDYLAVVTLGFAELVRIFFLNWDSVGGARGFYGIVAPDQLGWRWFYLWLWLLLALTSSGFLKFRTQGLKWLAIRQDELAARFLGISIQWEKIKALGLSAFWTGVSGALLAMTIQYLNPSMFGFQKNVELLMVAVLGGLGSLSGSLLASVVIGALPEMLRPLQQVLGKDLRLMFFAIILISLMLKRPTGFMGLKEWFVLRRIFKD